MKPLKIYLFFLLSLFQACIGVDYVDDPIVGDAFITVDRPQVVLMPGQGESIVARYFDEYGIERNVTFDWFSENTTVATVNQQGEILAIGAGQATVYVSYLEAIKAIEVNVVASDDAVATVEVVAPKTELGTGESISLSAIVRNIAGEILTDRTIEWFTENESIATLSQQGVLTGVTGGVVEIHAKVEGVKSNRINFTVLVVRMGTFVKAGGYEASGSATMKIVEGQLILELGSNFKTSFALGTYIYLSNTTSGSGTFANGLEIKQITSNGAHTFNVSQVNASVGLFDYRYCVVLCKPAMVTFGYADMN